MCSTPKTPTVQQPKEKAPVYMRNRYLDGLGIGAESGGRNSLRIDQGTPARTAPGIPVTATPTSTSSATAGLGMGSVTANTSHYGRRALNLGIGQ